MDGIGKYGDDGAGGKEIAAKIVIVQEAPAGVGDGGDVTEGFTANIIEAGKCIDIDVDRGIVVGRGGLAGEGIE